MWISRRRYQEDLESAARKAVEAVASQLKAEAAKSDHSALTQALEGLFKQQIESFGQNIGALGTFMGTMVDLSRTRAAVLLGQRGGRKRAENAKARQASIQPLPSCEVCENPLSTNNVAIVQHVQQGHAARRAAAFAASRENAAAHSQFVQQGQLQLPTPAERPTAASLTLPGQPSQQTVKGN